jgi:hypothetical protein
MTSKLDIVDEATNDEEQVVEVPPRKAKRAEKKTVTGESSMAPVKVFLKHFLIFSLTRYSL